MAYLQPTPWILVDWFTASALTSWFFGTGGNGVRNYPLSGNSDEGIKVRWALVAVALATPRFILNGSNANQSSTGNGVSTGSLNLSGTSFGTLGNGILAGGSCIGELVIERAATGQQRIGYIRNTARSSAPYAAFIQGRYADTVTNIVTVGTTVTGAMNGLVQLFVKNPQRR